MTGSEKRVVQEGLRPSRQSYLQARPHDGEDIALLAEGVARPPEPQSGPRRRMWISYLGGQAAPGSRTRCRWYRFFVRSLVPRSIEPRKCQLVQGDLTNLPFSNGSFDAVVSYYAIIHVPREEEYEALLREILRVLRQHGLALLCLGWGDLSPVGLSTRRLLELSECR